MKYSGRIGIVSVIIILITAIRMYGTLYYNYPIDKFPFIGICLVAAGWLLGKQFDKLKFQSEKDALTTLYNRRFILQAFPKLSTSIVRKQGKMILYFIDVDEFKLINDNHGHQIGDQILLRTANLLSRLSQPNDIVVRWAGDEFIILSPFSDESTKADIISRIHNELAMSSQELNITITVSIGTAEYPGDAQNLEDLFQAADQDMYRLKSERGKLREISGKI